MTGRGRSGRADVRAARSSARVRWLTLAAFAAATVARSAAASDEIEIRGMTFVSGDPGGRHLVVRAERARIEPTTETAHLEGVAVDVRDGPPGFTLTLECATAEVTLRDQGFRLEGDVRGRDGDGRRFRTEWLEYAPAAAVLHTEAPVTVFDGVAEYSGGALVYEIEARRLQLLRGARVVRRAP